MSAKKSNKPASGDSDQKPDRAAVRAANLAKFDWSRDVSADPHLSQAAKHLASRMAIDKFGPNGTARATQKELARICGTTIRTIRRATTELGYGNYWDVVQLGGANRYTLVPPDERVERWYAACRQWDSICRKWDRWKFEDNRRLEKEAQASWLDAEARAKDEFTMPIFEAAARRASENKVTDPYGFAIHMSEQWWDWKVRIKCPGSPKIVGRINAATDEQIVELATRRGYHTPAPRCTECATELPADRAELAVCIDCSWTVAEMPEADNMSAQADKIDTLGGQNRHPRRTESVPQADKAGALNCGNGNSTSTSSTPKYVEVLQDASPTGRAPTGAPSGAAQNIPSPQPVAGGQAMGGTGRPDCQLCDDNGHALRLDNGEPIAVTLSLDSDDWDDYDLDNNERPFMCTHSLAGNRCELKRLADDADADWAPTWTGYGEEIDGPDYDYDEEEIHAEMTGAASQFTDQRVGQ
ncbi:hypothetical protein [Mycobacterium nebraskense]|uniref:Uncharacterized protein n=1 Tax=Mycobacterium nebraskense TaxID=244292 RepID=A0A1X1ZG82_9MYCO|nr:hypothetical protein [Mycobacterium nebraskense]MBI2696151.1 hypothetical protein [Mycobacterium nebraskense]MCV7120323.1 hypothetical protein [Mycobacterium nebraskense]ORW22300.1 hypothetical protein AWC17_05160 [Mycobacterium nebraskense]